MYEYKAKCINVVDGDTIDIQIDLGFKILHEVRVRLLGVDTPELKIEEQHDRAVEVKNIVESELLNKDIIVRTQKRVDTYGRYLAEIILEDGTSYNNTLIERGLVKENSKWNTGV